MQKSIVFRLLSKKWYNHACEYAKRQILVRKCLFWGEIHKTRKTAYSSLDVVNTDISENFCNGKSTKT